MEDNVFLQWKATTRALCSEADGRGVDKQVAAVTFVLSCDCGYLDWETRNCTFFAELMMEGDGDGGENLMEEDTTS